MTYILKKKLNYNISELIEGVGFGQPLFFVKIFQIFLFQE